MSFNADNFLTFPINDLNFYRFIKRVLWILKGRWCDLFLYFFFTQDINIIIGIFSFFFFHHSQTKNYYYFTIYFNHQYYLLYHLNSRDMPNFLIIIIYLNQNEIFSKFFVVTVVDWCILGMVGCWTYDCLSNCLNLSQRKWEIKNFQSIQLTYSSICKQDEWENRNFRWSCTLAWWYQKLSKRWSIWRSWLC